MLSTIADCGSTEILELAGSPGGQKLKGPGAGASVLLTIVV